MCVNVYVCAYVHTCVHACVCPWVYVHACMCMCIWVCMYMGVYACVWVHVCMCAQMCAYACIYMCMHKYVKTRVSLWESSSFVLHLFYSLDILNVCKCCACIYVCTLCTCLIPVEARSEHQIPWNCSFRKLWALWGLIIKLGSSARTNALNGWTISPGPLTLIFEAGSLHWTWSSLMD